MVWKNEVNHGYFHMNNWIDFQNGSHWVNGILYRALTFPIICILFWLISKALTLGFDEIGIFELFLFPHMNSDFSKSSTFQAKNERKRKIK